MLDARRIPLVPLLEMKRPSHCRVMLGLYRYADEHGFCYPGLRTLAEEVSLAVRSLRRALEEMVELGYLIITKVKRGSVNRYQIAPRFLLPAVRRADDDEPAAAPSNTTIDAAAAAPEIPPTVSLSRTAVSPARTEGEAKESSKVLKKEGSRDFGCASAAAINEQPVRASNTQSPPDERPPATPAASSTQSAPVEVHARPAAAEEAYKAEIKRRKREQWILKLNGFVQRYFSNDLERMMAFLEVVTRAHNAVHDWASLSKDDRKALDWLDENLRNWEALHASARAA